MFDKATRDEIEFIANSYGWNPHALLAVVEVESNGIYEWDVNGEMLPPIRFEGHYFYKRLTGAARKRAVSEGLAHSRTGGVKNPRSYAGRYDLLARAKKIDADAALESISMGLGQVMGAWWEDLGYKSVINMFNRAKSGITGQVELMARFIEENNLGHLITGNPTLADFTKLARAYNGKGYKKNKYHTKIYAAYRRWQSGEEAVVMQPKIEWNKTIQKDLKTLGYFDHEIDGKVGPRTKAAVRTFQEEHGLVADGKPGTMTREAIDDELKAKDARDGDKAVASGAATTIAPSVVQDTAETVLEKVTDIQSLGIASVAVDYLVTGLTVVGVLLMCYGFYKKFTSRN